MNGKETPHYLHFTQTKLRPGETPLLFLEGWIGEMMGQGKKAQQNGCFVLTDQRAVFCRKGMMGEVFQAMPLEKISSVETKSSMGYRVLSMHTSHDEMRFKTFEQASLFEQTYNRLEDLRHQPSVSAGGEPQPDSPVDVIRKLAELRDAGVLSEEEFSAKKQELLSKI